MFANSSAACKHLDDLIYFVLDNMIYACCCIFDGKLITLYSDNKIHVSIYCCKTSNYLSRLWVKPIKLLNNWTNDIVFLSLESRRIYI